MVVRETILTLITYAVIWGLLYATLHRRGSILIHVLGHIAIFMVSYQLFYILAFTVLPPKIAAYCVSVLILFIAQLFFTENISKKNFAFFFFLNITTFFLVVCRYIARLIAPETHTLAVRVFLYLFFIAVFIIWYLQYFKSRMLVFLDSFVSVHYTILPVLAFALSVILFNTNDDSLSLFDIMLFFLFHGFVFVSYYVIWVLFTVIRRNTQSEVQIRDAERLLVMQKKYYVGFEQALQEQNSLLLLTHQQMQSLLSSIQNNDFDLLRPQIELMLNSENPGLVRRYCQNTVANAVIGSCVKIAEEKGISVTTELDIPEDIGIGQYELSSLFGNTIENAIEACSRIPSNSDCYLGRSIVIKARCENSRFAIRIENTFQPALSDSPGLFPSSKGTAGGLGLESVASIVAQYRGSHTCQRLGHTFVFSALLMVSAPNEVPSRKMAAGGLP